MCIAIPGPFPVKFHVQVGGLEPHTPAAITGYRHIRRNTFFTLSPNLSTCLKRKKKKRKHLTTPKIKFKKKKCLPDCTLLFFPPGCWLSVLQLWWHSNRAVYVQLRIRFNAVKL